MTVENRSDVPGLFSGSLSRSLSGEPTGSPLFKNSLDRRRWIAGAGSLLGGSLLGGSLIANLGCRPSSGPTSENRDAGSATSRQVPLRIVWAGTESDIDTLRRTWQSISEQPLDVRLVPLDKGPAQGDVGTTLMKMAEKADVVVYPLILMAEMVTQKQLMPLLSDPSENNETDVFVETDRKSLPAALKVATSFAGERRAVPLGGHLPALMLGETIGSQPSQPPIMTWADYHELAQANPGKCAEPTSEGWAGAMFLWRLCSSLDATWLFDRSTMAPLIDQPEYVAVLEQMERTVKLDSNRDGRTPGEIFQAVAAGDLDAGIGFPYSKSENNNTNAEQITFVSLPSGRSTLEDALDSPDADRDLSRSMMNPFMLVGSLASSCRQTAAADRFLKWLAGGQASEALYRNIDSLVDLRITGKDSGATAGYPVWLRNRLSNPNVVPSLQILGAIEYYRVLDGAVRECVHGGVTAKETCTKIADEWSDLHRRYDLPAQQRVWRRTQGLS